ncbi:MAG: hypothetical protein JXL84_25775 [Deltaproteobacteria bacterium]|nr:hypothetical protein [Deltaproteobacteria bacterium]
MLKIDYSVFVQIVNFLILIFLLNIILYRPIRKVLQQRRDEMDALEGAAGGLQGKAAKHERELNENAVAARREGYGEKESLRSEALDLEKKMYQDATASAAEKMEGATKERVAVLGEIRQALEKDVGLFSRELAAKILGRSL